MNETRITINTDGGRVVISVTGDVDLSNADQLEREAVAAIANDTLDVVLDLGRVGYLDSAGLRVVYSLTSRLRRLQIDFAVAAPEGSPARRVIEMTGMAAVAPLVSG